MLAQADAAIPQESPSLLLDPPPRPQPSERSHSSPTRSQPWVSTGAALHKARPCSAPGSSSSPSSKLPASPFTRRGTDSTGARAYPSDICDILGIIAVFALGPNAAPLAPCLSATGASASSTQAFITPILHHGPDSIRFWMFWGSHTVILASSVYDLAVNRFRPTWRDFGIITLAIPAYGRRHIPL